MNAARAADEAAGFVEPGKAGPAVQATMHARLRNLAEARFWRKAMAFVDEDYPAEVTRVYEKILGPEVSRMSTEVRKNDSC